MADLLGAVLCTNEQETVLWEPRIKPIPALTSQVRRRRGNVNSGSPFKYWETQMRKSIILVIAIAMCSILSGKTWAGKVSLGKHNADEIETICNSVGGAFWSKSGTYGCANECAGGTSACVVSCTKNGNCTGECPSCGRREQSPLPVLGGGRMVSHALRNSVPIKRD